MAEFKKKTGHFNSNRSGSGHFNSGRATGGRRNFGDHKPEIYELRIEKMVQGGEGMAHLEDGRVCFVAGALPGELCQVKITFKKKDFTKGVAIKILESSPDRVTPKCPLYGKCGGCSLQHLTSEKQVEYMAQVERENFRRLAHAELPEDFKIHTGNPWGYRNRARVVYSPARGGSSVSDGPDGPDGLKPSKAKVGFRAQESNAIIGFENCPVLTPALNDFLKGLSIETRERELDVNVFDNGVGQVSYYYRGMPSSAFAKNAVSVVEISGRKIQADASVFFQSNLGLLPELVESVRNAVDEGIASGEASDEWLIDLFSGVGFFAAFLKDKFKKVTTVEREEGCLKHAKVNLAAASGASATNGCVTTGATVVENVSAPAEDWLTNHVVNVPATLIVDPPRTGLPKEALDAIIASSVNRLIYVSCDPVTLARDYAKFAAAGFALKKAEGFAFYPQTPHMEMMFILAR